MGEKGVFNLKALVVPIDFIFDENTAIVSKQLYLKLYAKYGERGCVCGTFNEITEALGERVTSETVREWTNMLADAKHITLNRLDYSKGIYKITLDTKFKTE